MPAADSDFEPGPPCMATSVFPACALLLSAPDGALEADWSAAGASGAGVAPATSGADGAEGDCIATCVFAELSAFGDAAEAVLSDAAFACGPFGALASGDGSGVAGGAFMVAPCEGLPVVVSLAVPLPGVAPGEFGPPLLIIGLAVAFAFGE